MQAKFCGPLFQMWFLPQQTGKSFMCGPGGFGIVALPSLEIRPGLVARGFPEISLGDPFPSFFKNFIYISLHRLAALGGSQKTVLRSLCLS